MSSPCSKPIQGAHNHNPLTFLRIIVLSAAMSAAVVSERRVVADQIGLPFIRFEIVKPPESIIKALARNGPLRRESC